MTFQSHSTSKVIVDVWLALFSTTVFSNIVIENKAGQTLLDNEIGHYTKVGSKNARVLPSVGGTGSPSTRSVRAPRHSSKNYTYGTHMGRTLNASDCF